MFWVLVVAAAILLGTAAVLFVISGSNRRRLRYPDSPGAPLDDGLPGEACVVPWKSSDPVITAAEACAADFKRLADAGALDLVVGARESLAELSRPVAIGLIMEALAPIVAPAPATGVFAHWYAAMALVYYIDDRIVDRAAVGAYRSTLSTLRLKDSALAGVLAELGYAARLV
jgi:hypothetical protein